MVESPGCALCRRRAESLVAVAGQAFCLPCLTALGKLMREGEPALVEFIWRARPRELARRALADIVDDEVQKIRQVAPKGDASVEARIADFKAGFAHPKPAEPVVSPADAVTHLDLAVAYRAMGLGDDALEEASIALASAAHLGSRADEAAEILLDPQALRSSLGETLVTLRSALFPQ